MEYVPLPRDPALPPIEIMLHDPERHWHDVTWEEHRSGTYWDQFPRRYGYEHDEYWSGDQQANKAWGNPNFHRWIMSMQLQELEDFIISWLFFGTLAEVTGCNLSKEEHLQATADGRCLVRLTSAHMDRFLNRWHCLVTHFRSADYVRGSTEEDDESMGYVLDPEAFYEGRASPPPPRGMPGQLSEVIEAELDAQGRSLPFERAFRCLERSQAIAGLLCETIDLKIIYVVATLHEFLASALKDFIFRGEVADAYAGRSAYQLGQWIEGADFTHYNRAALRSLRWCPRTEVQLWRLKSRTLALDHFAVNLKTVQTVEDHSSCSEDFCAAYQLDTEAYTNPHVVAEASICDCEHLGLDPVIASAILASDGESYPVIKLSRTEPNDDATIFVESFNSSEVDDYVAISHVWSHGLGNPKQNSLPGCQLQRMQVLVDNLASHENIGVDAIPFWMDTLCCPIQPKEARRAAITKMAKTYERATCVLVIDRSLMAIDTKDLSKLEILMQVFRTTWMHRLWTLQEAKLAKKLRFQFRDEAVSIERLLDQLLTDSTSISQLLFRKQFLPALQARCNGLRERYHDMTQAHDMPYTEDCYRLISLAYSLSGRSTSWASDEATCIVNILGFDVTPILEISTDDPSCAALRMREMWRQWTAVPLAVIFNRAPRLPYKGFRWAHSTFVRTQRWAIPVVEVEHNGVLDPDGQGLLVTPSSFLLRNNLPLTMVDLDIKLERETDNHWARTAGTGGLQKFQTFLILDCLSGNWYAVRIRDRVLEPMPKVGQDAELAIIYTEDRNESNTIDPEMPGLLVSTDPRDAAKGVLHATSLYHVTLSRLETAAEKLFNAGLQVRHILQETPALCGKVEEGKVVTGPEFDSANSDIQLAIAKGNLIARTVLGEPDVSAYIMTTMLKNQDPSTVAWRTATEEQRRDWDFRVDHGDVGHFYNQIVNFWLNLAFVPAMPAPRGLLTWCVD